MGSCDFLLWTCMGGSWLLHFAAVRAAGLSFNICGFSDSQSIPVGFYGLDGRGCVNESVKVCLMVSGAGYFHQ